MKDLRNDKMLTIGTENNVLLVENGVLQLDMRRNDVQVMKVYDENSSFSTTYTYDETEDDYIQTFDDKNDKICSHCGSYKYTDYDHIKNCIPDHVSKKFIIEMIQQIIDDNKNSNPDDNKTILVINGITFLIL